MIRGVKEIALDWWLDSLPQNPGAEVTLNYDWKNDLTSADFYVDSNGLELIKRDKKSVLVDKNLKHPSIA